MQENINDFITEYESWAGQEKYKDFKFISKSLSPAWKKRLLENKKFNIWGLLFGPIYLMVLGAALSGFLLLLLEIFAVNLVFAFSNDFSLAILSFFAFNALLFPMMNKAYIKQKQEFKKKMQDFDPDAPMVLGAAVSRFLFLLLEIFAVNLVFPPSNDFGLGILLFFAFNALLFPMMNKASKNIPKIKNKEK